MLQKLFFPLLLLIFLFISCGENSNSFYDGDIEYIPLDPEETFMFDEIYMPRKMRVYNGNLLVSDFRNDPSFHLLTLGENGMISYNRGEGTEGQGPGEFMLIEDFTDADSLLYVFDANEMKLVKYDQQFNPTGLEIHLESEGRPLAVYAVSDDTFVISGLFPGERFQVINRSGETIGRHGELINIDEEMNPFQLGMSWYSFSAIHPQGDYIYLFSSNSDHIQKYSVDGELFETVKGDEHPLPRKRLEEVNGEIWPVDDGSKYSYLWAESDDQYIYALYSGKMQSEEERFLADKLHVFDWDLNLKAAYQLDHTPFTFAADGKGGLYTVTQTGEGPVYRYLTLNIEE